MEVPSSFDVVVSADGLAFYGADFWSGEESVRLWEALSERVAWKQQSIRIFGRFVVQPRLTCWMGDDGVRYTYSGLTHDPEPWMPEVLQLKCALERTLAVSFNGVLLNLYRNGLDSMGWHRDNEMELGKEPVIASVSLGATRRFLLRRYKSRDRARRCLSKDTSFRFSWA
jgi:alkylated DNA repair dioxygenase AlkB